MARENDGEVVEDDNQFRAVVAAEVKRKPSVPKVEKLEGGCDEPLCGFPAEIVLQYRRAKSTPDSIPIVHGRYCLRHCRSNARLVTAFGHKLIPEQEYLAERKPPTWTEPMTAPPHIIRMPPPAPKAAVTPEQEALAAEIAKGGAEVKQESEKRINKKGE
jgi:hypothetical protein